LTKSLKPFCLWNFNGIVSSFKQSTILIKPVILIVVKYIINFLEHKTKTLLKWRLENIFLKGQRSHLFVLILLGAFLSDNPIRVIQVLGTYIFKKLKQSMPLCIVVMHGLSNNKRTMFYNVRTSIKLVCIQQWLLIV